MLQEIFENVILVEDEILMYIGNFGPSPPYEDVFFIPVTKHDDDQPSTDVRMARHPFHDDEFLPEVQPIMDFSTCRNVVEEDAILVQIVDTVWGRPFWLFDKIHHILDHINRGIHVLIPDSP